MKKLLIFLMIAIPLVIIIVVNLTVNVVAGFVSIAVDEISLNQTQVEAKIEDTLSLEASILPKNATNKDVIWASTNEDVATVDLNGNVSFIGFGNGYITATTVDGNKRASCYFYVTDTNVHQITLTSEFIENGNYFVGINETLQLTSVISPSEAINKNVYYYSEDESIATVDSNGLVYGLQEGRVKITSISEQYSTIKDSIIVEVVKPLESIDVLIEKAITSTKTYQISYKVFPIDASVSSVIYSSSDESIATVNSSGFVTFKKPGMINVGLTSVQGQLKTSIEIEYTNGYASDLILATNMINASINQGGIYIQYNTIPASVDVNVEFSSDNEDIVYVDDSGYIQFIGGGSTLVRAKILKDENEYIEKIISVYVESPATGIVIDNNIVIATKTYHLIPKSYPNSSTNENYFYHSTDTGIASVSPEGVISFVKNEYCSVAVDIYANADFSDVKKTIVVTYTNGYPIDLNLEETDIELNYGEYRQIVAILSPENVINNTIEYKITKQEQNGNGNSVIEVLAEGTIKAIGGGIAVVEVSCTKYSGEKIIKKCNVKVIRKIEDVDIVTDLDFYNGGYVTCQQQVDFTIINKTSDATDTRVLWKLKNNIAIKNGEDGIIFNSVGTAEILAYTEDKNYSETIYIKYLKNNIIEAELEEIPLTLDFGDVYTFNLISTIPSNAVCNLYIRISNQITSSPLGKVFEIIENNKIKAIAGGAATVTVIISNIQFTYNIESVRKAENIVVTPANITTTKNKIALQTSVLPEDTTNKTVIYEVSDENIAYIENGVLVFKNDGVINITAYSVDDRNVCYEFTIEKTEKGTGDISITGDPIIMQIGETNTVNMENIDFIYDTIDFVVRNQEPILNSEEVIEVVDGVIKAISLGQAEIDCVLTNEYGTEKIVSIKIIVIQLSEEVEFSTDLDLVLDEYITAESTVDLSFNLLPTETTNKKYCVSIIKFVAVDGSESYPYIENNKLIFTTSGTVLIKVVSEDNNISKQFRIKYTGGNAIDAVLNFQDEQKLSIGEKITVLIQKWIPYNTENKQVFIREISHSQGVSKVIDISQNEITAIAGGMSKISIELSNGIIKELSIIVLTQVTDLIIDDEILTTQTQIVLNPILLPSNATNKLLIYNLENNDIAYIDGKTVNFTKPGNITLTISTTDGSNLSKQVKITSTFGYVGKIELNTNNRVLVKGSQFSLFVKTILPTDAVYRTMFYKVLNQETNDETDNAVVSITDDGIVKGLYGGRAVVRVYCYDYYGNEIYNDCSIEVTASVARIEVAFDRELSTSQGSIVIAQPDLTCLTSVYPTDATNKNIDIMSDDESIAIVQNNKITFLKAGKVIIRFTAQDISAGTIYKTYSFYYTEETLISATLEEEDFAGVEKLLTLDVGQNYVLQASSYIPNDISNIKFNILDKIESRIDISKPVISFNDGVIKALNGGDASFTIKINNLIIGRYSVRVMRKCSEIHVENNEVFVSNNKYSIQATAYPLDTYQTDLTYELIDGNGTVDSNGMVTFNSYGIIEVKISCLADTNIYTIIKIEYANEVKRITFNETVSQIYAGEKVDLVVKAEPFNAKDYTIIFESSDSSIATVNQSGRIIAGQTKGIVTIKAYVKENPSIFTERTFTIITVLTDLALELDEVGNVVGIGGYRVWGNKFISNIQEENGVVIHSIISNYQMKIASIKPADSGINLIWKSSDEEIATVDQNGKVTFTDKEGQVTISVEPEVQYDIVHPLRDSYTFNVLSGINVYSYYDTGRASQLCRKSPNTEDEIPFNIVLQNNIVAKGSTFRELELKSNLYGNGYMIDFSETDYYDKIVINTNGITIDNVYLRGNQFGSQAALTELNGKGKVLFIGRNGRRVIGTIIKNTVIENAMIGVEAKNCIATFAGCIIRNTCSAGLLITRGDGDMTPSQITVKDCIFSRSLFSSILFQLEQNAKNLNYKSHLTIDGEVRFYNWLKVSEFQADFIEKYVPNATSQLRDMLSSYPQYIYEYNGEKYIMLGITSIDVKASAAGLEIPLRYSCCGEVSFMTSSPYTRADVKGHIIVYGVGSGDGSCVIYTLTKDTTYITPASTYENDPNTYSKIRQPK